MKSLHFHLHKFCFPSAVFTRLQSYPLVQTLAQSMLFASGRVDSGGFDELPEGDWAFDLEPGDWGVSGLVLSPRPNTGPSTIQLWPPWLLQETRCLHGGIPWAHKVVAVWSGLTRVSQRCPPSADFQCDIITWGVIRAGSGILWKLSMKQWMRICQTDHFHWPLPWFICVYK